MARCNLLLLLTVFPFATTEFSQAAEPMRPSVVAHRGLRGHAPENTLANFRACLELRIGFEFDVERALDGQLICIHDSTVDRTTNGSGRIADMTLAEIRTLDAGSWFDPEFADEKVPTVNQVLELVAQYRDRDVLIAVDLKAENVGPEVVRLAEQHGVLQRLVFIGKTISEPAVRKEIRQASPLAQTAAVANSVEEFPQALSATDATWVYVRYLPSAEQVEAIHDANKRAFIAGVTVSGNVPINWQLAAAAGVDGILTDFPLELGATVRRLPRNPDKANVPTPVVARLIALRTQYVLPQDRHGRAFRTRIMEETVAAKLPPAPFVDLILELTNVSQEDVIIWPKGTITNPDLEIRGPGIVAPNSLVGVSAALPTTRVQATIAPGETHRISIASLNPWGGTPLTYWYLPGEYSLKASYVVHTGLPPFPTPNLPGGKKPKEKRRRYEVTTTPLTVRVVLESD